MFDYFQNIFKTFINGYTGYANYLWQEITHPSWHNYFYWLLIVSAFFFILEAVKPWRESQPVFRKDFWLDFFYMFFNFFLFSLVFYNAASEVFVNIFNDIVHSITSIDLRKINPMYNWPMWAILLVGFVVRDFVQWWTHRLLHNSEWLWNFHKVHHSVKEMGFAAHLRYHWMETIVYRFIEYIPLAMLGIGLYDFFVIHIFTLAIGHYNHSNFHISGRYFAGILGFIVSIASWHGLADITFMNEMNVIEKLATSTLITLGSALLLGRVIKKIFNNPEMHIWHHSYDLPVDHIHGVNYGITLSIWDYIFGTDYMPNDGKSIRLGFPGDENFPKSFIEQAKYGFKRKT